MSLPRPLRALLFDFDGLILDTESTYYDSWQETYAHYGLTLDVVDWAGMIVHGSAFLARAPYEAIEARTGRAIDHGEIRLHRRAAFERRMAEATALPGVAALIDDARRAGIRLGVASNSPRDWVVGYLERLGLYAPFDAIRCGDDVARPKPAPEVYVALMDALGVAPGDAVALEDSASGAAAAKAAGLYCVVAPNRVTRHHLPDTTDLHVDSLEALCIATGSAPALRLRD